jgi:hypothetical protein
MTDTSEDRMTHISHRVIAARLLRVAADATMTDAWFISVRFHATLDQFA